MEGLFDLEAPVVNHDLHTGSMMHTVFKYEALLESITLICASIVRHGGFGTEMKELSNCVWNLKTHKAWNI